MLCGVPLYAQQPMGSPSSQNPNGATPGSQASPMPGANPGGMPGTSPSGMNDGMNGGAGKISADDKHFMKDAMEGDMAEIQLAKLAQQKASSDQVKQFAQRMIDDHTRLDSQMKPMAQQFGVEAPTELSAKHKAVEAKLQGLSGDKFDQEYIRSMVADHREDDQAFVREETTAGDPELKNAVSQAEPIIADHLRMAQDIEKSMKGKGSGSM
jgi:putative membrane protein